MHKNAGDLSTSGIVEGSSGRQRGSEGSAAEFPSSSKGSSSFVKQKQKKRTKKSGSNNKAGTSSNRKVKQSGSKNSGGASSSRRSGDQSGLMNPGKRFKLAPVPMFKALPTVSKIRFITINITSFILLF